MPSVREDAAILICGSSCTPKASEEESSRQRRHSDTAQTTASGRGDVDENRELLVNSGFWVGTYAPHQAASRGPFAEDDQLP